MVPYDKCPDLSGAIMNSSECIDKVHVPPEAISVTVQPPCDQDDVTLFY